MQNNMTNEEKAKEIAERCYRDYVDEGNMIGSSEECYESALQAMQWKDEQAKEQRKELINKACKWLKEQESWDYYNDAPCKLMSKDKIAEFRKAMEK